MRILKRKKVKVELATLRNGNMIVLKDNHITMPDGGVTRIKMSDKDIYEIFSFGRNWKDQQVKIYTEEELRKYLGNIYLKYHRNAVVFCASPGLSPG